MEATSCDGKLNPQGWSECIRQGISAKVDGIIVIGQDCSSFQSALQEAKNAGIPTIGAGGNDCDISGGDKLYSATTQMLPDMTAQQWWEKMGALQAAWIIDKTDGKASVLSLKFTDAIWGGWIQDGFEAELATCDGCKVEDTLELGNQDVGERPAAAEGLHGPAEDADGERGERPARRLVLRGSRAGDPVLGPFERPERHRQLR